MFYAWVDLAFILLLDATYSKAAKNDIMMKIMLAQLMQTQPNSLLRILPYLAITAISWLYTLIFPI